MTKIQNIIVSLIFILSIGLISTNQVIKFIGDTEDTENRAKAKRPVMDINRLDSYPKKFDTYFQDNFLPRNRVMKINSWINNNLFKKKFISKNVLIGKDDWMYYIRNELPNYRGNNLFSKEELETIRNEFVYRNDTLKKLGIKMYVFLIPDKFSVYPEYVPKYLKKSNFNRTDQILALFDTIPEIKIFKIDSELKKLKDTIPLYFKYDNHWNEYGGFCGSQIISGKLIDEGINILNHDIDQYKLTTSQKKDGNLGNMIPGNIEYLETAFHLTPKYTTAEKIDIKKYPPPNSFGVAHEFQFFYDNHCDSLCNVLFFRDSFGNYIMPFLKNSFNKTTFIFDAWKYELNFEIINNEKPDLVIYLILENLFHNVLENTTFANKDR